MRIVLSVIVLAACSHGAGRSTSTAWNGEGTRVDASTVCRQYLKGPYVKAAQTTVGRMRDTPIGPSRAHRFPQLGDSDEAVWCWTGVPGAYNVYALTTAGDVETVATTLHELPHADASGAPIIP